MRPRDDAPRHGDQGHRRGRLIAAVAGGLGVVALAALAAVAWAYWSGTGAGAASVGVGSLSPPTGVAPTVSPGSTTVSVAWTGVTAPGGGGVDGYYVVRHSGASSSPACSSSPTALLGAAVTSCNDTSVPNGSYTYTVTAVFRSWTATSAPSSGVTVDAVASFTVAAPASTTAGAPLSVTVTAKDQSNATITGYVGTVHFTTSDASGVVPANYTFVPSDNGSHTFSNGATLETVPSQTITVNDVAVPTATGSTTLTVSAAAAAALAFTQQPGGGTAATAWTTQPRVTVDDAYGNIVTSSSASVTLAITPGTGNPSGVLTCTANPKAATSGVVTFAGCKINKSAAGYTLTASSAGLTNGVSSSFTITPGPATQVVYTQAPTTVTAGAAITPAVVATIEDANGNTVTSSSATVAIAISTNPGGGTLSGTTSVAASSGVATFSNLSIDKAAAGYKLTASSTGLTSAVSGTFTVNPGTATQLVFTQQPGGGTGGTAWTTQPKVTVEDALGNTVTSSSASVTLAITAGTGNPSGVLTCTANPKAAASGVVTFAGCKISLAGTGYTLTATSAGLTSAVSSAFGVTVGPATQLVYSQGPTTVTAGTAITPALTVTVEDAGGDVVTSSSATVAITISTNPGGGTLSGTTSVAASSGVATFSNLSIDKAAAGYKLTASSTGLTSAVSGTFTVNPGTASQLVFTQQPGGGTHAVAWATQPKVTVEDAFGNTVTSSSASVTLTITTGTGNPSGVLTCTANPKAAASGVVTFAGCKISLAGTGYTLTATSAGLTSAVSSAFNVT